MKVKILACLLTSISFVNAFEVNQIEGVEGDIYNVKFDSDFNTFVVAYDLENVQIKKIYKLDPQKNITFTIELEDFIAKTMITNQNDFYIITWLTGFFTSVNVIRAGSTDMENILIVNKLSDVYMDNFGNLIIYGIQGDPGVLFLKHSTSEIFSVKNLENFLCLRQSSVVIDDEHGNTYIEGSYWSETNGQMNQLAVIKAESKEKVPEGEIIEGILDDPTKDYVERLAITSNNELLISATDVLTTGYLKKLSNDTISTIFSNEKYQHYYTEYGKTGILIKSCDLKVELKCGFSYLTEDDKIVNISNLQNQTYEEALYYETQIDEEGNVFISGYDVLDQSTVEFFNHTDSKTIGVDFGGFPIVYEIRLDGNNNLWVLADDGIHFIEKGSLKPEKAINDTTGLVSLYADINKKANEVFYTDGKGLYAISN